MSYQVMAFTTSPFTQQRIYQLLCDTPEDLPASAVTGDYPGNLSQGCTAKVISNSAEYMYNSAGSWIRQAGNNVFENVYTKTEVDDLIDAAMSTVITKADIYRGWHLVSSAEEPLDINSVTDYGTYYCSDGTTAATIQNCPITSSGFIMINFSNGNRVRLFLAISATIPRMFIQARTGGTWRTIRQFAMTDEIQYDENMLGYNWGRYNVAESTGDVNPSTTRIGTPDYFEIPAGTQTITYSPFFDGVRGDVFYLFYDSNKVYNNIYIGWVSAGVPVKVPSGQSFYRLCFRRPDNATIIVSDMIRCSRNFS